MAKGVTVVKDNVSKVFKSITDLVGKQVLVGIPESKDRRDDGPIGNAAIGYTMEFGSPANNVPARPFLIPGVEKVERSTLNQLKQAAEAALNGDAEVSDQKLNAAGIIASNSVRTEISSNIPPPLAPGTIRGRRHARGTKSRRESEDVYLNLISQGVDASAAQMETGIVSLVNTGQLRASITYVIVKGK